MKRTAIARGERIEAREVSKLPMPARKATLKSKGPRMTPIRKSARDEECTLRFPVCNGDTKTTVWAHSNNYQDGKGGSIKARDEEGCYACFACHSWLDGGYAGHMLRETVEVFFNLARINSQAILRRKGLMK
jgi:hypothetical protein